VRGADAVFANLEGTVHTWDEGTPGITQVTFMTTEPRLLEDLKWLGISMVSCANNHAFDYGEGGVLANIKHLDDAGLVLCGRSRRRPLRPGQGAARADVGQPRDDSRGAAPAQLAGSKTCVAPPFGSAVRKRFSEAFGSSPNM